MEPPPPPPPTPPLPPPPPSPLKLRVIFYINPPLGPSAAGVPADTGAMRNPGNPQFKLSSPNYKMIRSIMAAETGVGGVSGGTQSAPRNKMETAQFILHLSPLSRNSFPRAGSPRE